MIVWRQSQVMIPADLQIDLGSISDIEQSLEVVSNEDLTDFKAQRLGMWPGRLPWQRIHHRSKSW